MERPRREGGLRKDLPRAEILAAARRFAAFHNEKPESVEIEHIPTTAFLLGNMVAVTYEVIENGRKVTYHHEFDAPPALAISHDGKTAFILSGEWTFTKRGFEG